MAGKPLHSARASAILLLGATRHSMPTGDNCQRHNDPYDHEGDARQLLRYERMTTRWLAAALLVLTGSATTVNAQCNSLQNCDASTFAAAVSCTSTGELCEPRYSVCINMPNALDVRFKVGPMTCGSGRIHVFVDDVEVYVTPFLGWPGATGDFATYPLGTGFFSIAVSPGAHTLALQEEGQVSGCNTGQTYAWEGDVFVRNGVGTPCDDGNACTGTDTCAGGICGGQCVGADADGDGEVDATDRCPNTPTGEAVDDAGCSLSQFCARFDATTRDGARACKRADWRNDEPLMKRKDADCVVQRATTGHVDDRCVPAPLSR